MARIARSDLESSSCTAWLKPALIACCDCVCRPPRQAPEKRGAQFSSSGPAIARKSKARGGDCWVRQPTYFFTWHACGLGLRDAPARHAAASPGPLPGPGSTHGRRRCQSRWHLRRRLRRQGRWHGNTWHPAQP